MSDFVLADWITSEGTLPAPDRLPPRNREALLRDMCEGQFNQLVDYVLPNDGPEHFMAECRTLDEIIRMGILVDGCTKSYEELGRDVVEFKCETTTEEGEPYEEEREASGTDV